ncbi:MAG: glycine dehydrogenase subunit 2 [Thermoproteota archaeon]|nr:glycine dehydrogenase subunit 2 [Thermoproteota archaeon]
MKEFRQAKWHMPTIFEIGAGDRSGCELPKLDSVLRQAIGDPSTFLPKDLMRTSPPNLPETSEVEVLRHFTKLSQMAFGVDEGFYPLGSCTMKYNPKINEALANLDEVNWIHPYQDESTVQGALELMYKLSCWLIEITGMHSFSLQPSAGAHGEFAGTLIMRAYHKHNSHLESKDEVLIPDLAHGTNPASAAMAGFKVIIIPSGIDGCIDIEALKNIVSKRTAGLMLTNPNTLGIFEKEIVEISKILHEEGALLYYDGANFNGIMGKVRPGDMGFDIVHLNLHKTFSTPHGGGGPGSGPVGVVEELDKFLPIPLIQYDGEKYYLDYNRTYSIGKIRGFYGNFDILVRAFSYILTMGAEGLENAAEIAVLNANYLSKRLANIKGFELPYDNERPRKHECVISCSKMKRETGVQAKNVAKRLIDFGIHPPTMYFPLIIDEALMIEPTETETIEELEGLVDMFAEISKEAYSTPNVLLEAPHNSSFSQMDEVKASHPRTLCLSWRMHQRMKHEKKD